MTKTSISNFGTKPCDCGVCNSKKKSEVNRDKRKEKRKNNMSEEATKKWTYVNGGMIGTSRGEFDLLQAGRYEVFYDGRSDTAYLKAMSYENDDQLIITEKMQAHAVINTVQSFWEKMDLYKQLGFSQKRGFLLYGLPGTGKTATINALSDEIANNHNGVVIFCSGDINACIEGIQLVREIEPERKILCVMEDLDALCRQNDVEDILSMLDGEDSTTNIIYISTTNFPESIDRRLINRPSRFDDVILIGPPNEEERYTFLHNKMHTIADETTIKNVVKETDGMVICELKELIISVWILGRDYKETLKRLKRMQQKVVKIAIGA